MTTSVPRHARWFLALGGIAAALAVALGAAATHGLRGLLAVNDPAGWFPIALEYHRWHAVGLMLAGLAAVAFPSSRWFAAAGWLLAAGLVLFSGNLYLRTLAGVHVFHAVTPFGGGAFILGWLAFAAGALSAGRK
ncbi:MAG TPA: DUF423 domain-containing protein [Rhodocyclaceae bacterium]